MPLPQFLTKLSSPHNHSLQPLARVGQEWPYLPWVLTTSGQLGTVKAAGGFPLPVPALCSAPPRYPLLAWVLQLCHHSCGLISVPPAQTHRDPGTGGHGELELQPEVHGWGSSSWWQLWCKAKWWWWGAGSQGICSNP